MRRAVKLAPGDETVRGELDKAVEDLKAAGLEDDGECPDFEGGAAGGKRRVCYRFSTRHSNVVVHPPLLHGFVSGC